MRRRRCRTLSTTAALGAVLAGTLLGGLAGYAGGALDDVLMRATDFVMVLPAMYVALALRAVLPLVLSAQEVFWLLAAIFAILGAPFIARGVRSIVRTERRLEYAVAAEALGANAGRTGSGEARARWIEAADRLKAGTTGPALRDAPVA